jgi:lipoprotein-anchoring transpeptidase ErfK/SrfK
MGLRVRVVAAAAVATAGIADPASAALSASGGEPADPRRSLIAEVPQGAKLDLHAAPGGRVIKRISDETVFGSRTRLAVVAGRGEWLQVSTETADDRRRAWIRASDVRLRDTTYRLVVSLDARRLELFDGSRRVFRTRVAVGSTAHPTPTGRFGVTDKLAGRRFGNVYGCCILAISAVQEQLPANWPGGNRIALHGTNVPSTIGNPVSTGCVRVGERPLRRLMRRVPLGTPVIIR